ncbi:hypothetical protein CIHG_02530 [Coccidioides immitis H538.4]|uniref:Uncharacterized protein n=2 Tax=Coccidioides immitis TaxID=5501 RepID=A0A0J8RJ99_COCIT|nr:hypothetical protein CIRG_02863 [Coccidioides immitis RMSCC 2394]KMU84746.1 hypothetical protein CIHG_02530 [Coccidioides immitis H538.4]
MDVSTPYDVLRTSTETGKGKVHVQYGVHTRLVVMSDITYAVDPFPFYNKSDKKQGVKHTITSSLTATQAQQKNLKSAEKPHGKRNFWSCFVSVLPFQDKDFTAEWSR